MMDKIIESKWTYIILFAVSMFILYIATINNL